MKLILTTNNGEVLDQHEVTAAEWKEAEEFSDRGRWAAQAILNCLVPGTNALHEEAAVPPPLKDQGRNADDRIHWKEQHDEA